ncbi:hypothetical protein [Actinoplanes sp. URMC 104]|uniref:hypothetical protein n=1 Tax=Actinoplanes sp. URMC 104 TaxID=3423409 RepID=UPI003F1D1A7A
MAVAVVAGSLVGASPALAAPVTSGTLQALGGGTVTATGFTSSWPRGTINLDVILYNNGKLKNEVENVCRSSTSCHNNPTPIVSCGCPGHWELAVYADNGHTYDSFHKEITASLVAGKLVLTEGKVTRKTTVK